MQLEHLALPPLAANHFRHLRAESCYHSTNLPSHRITLHFLHPLATTKATCMKLRALMVLTGVVPLNLPYPLLTLALLNPLKNCRGTGATSRGEAVARCVVMAT